MNEDQMKNEEDKLIALAKKGANRPVDKEFNDRITALEEDIKKEIPMESVVERAVTKVVAKLSLVENGKDGLDGNDGLDGEQGPPGKDGRDGRDGREGVDGVDGKDGRDGKDGLPGATGKDGANGKDGLDGSPDTPDQIIEKINLGSFLIRKERVEGLLQAIQNTAANAVAAGVAVTTSFFNGLRAKNLTIVGTGTATVSSKQVGDTVIVTVNATGGNGGTTFYAEQMTDSGDHQNFTAVNTITSVMSLMDGSGKGIPNSLYSLASNTLTLTAADANIASLGLFITYA